MDLLDDKPRDRRPNELRTMGWAECAYRLGSITILSGLGPLLLLVLGAWRMVDSVFGGMESADKRATIESLADDHLVSISGWIVAIVAVLIGWASVRFQRRSYENQISAMRDNKERALKITEEVELSDFSAKKSK